MTDKDTNTVHTSFLNLTAHVLQTTAYLLNTPENITQVQLILRETANELRKIADSKN